MKTTGFGYKNAWIAARGSRPAAVAEALGLRNVRAVAWDAGLAASSHDASSAVFVTPAIDGWVLGVGCPLFTLADERAPVVGQRVAEWAARLQTEVQYFCTHRVVEAHAWVRARPSGLERAYAYLGESGEKLLDEGQPTVEERALGFAFFDPGSPEAEAEGYWEREDLAYATEEHVLLLASRWSLDPTSLDARDIEVGDGLIGDFEPPDRAGLDSPRVPTVSPGAKPWWKIW
jgi:hypothetical protein